MKFHNTSMALLFSFTMALPVLAQHSDIEFTYEDGKIAVEFGDEGQVFESDFPTSGDFEQLSDAPGFASEEEEGLGVNPDNTIDYNVLGPLLFHNGTDFADLPAGAQLRIEDNPTGDWVVDGSTAGPVTGPGVISQADAGGDVHTHIEFALEPASLDSSAYGAYGLLMQLTTDEAGIDNSDPFYIVYNFGLEEEVFEGAVESFAAIVPEPSSWLLGLTALLGIIRMRRRKVRR